MSKTLSNKISPFELSIAPSEDNTASDRSFGLVFAVFFAVIGIFKFGSVFLSYFPWFFCSGLMLVLAFFLPHTLAPLNKQWMRLGLLLHKITSPIIMFILFYGIFTPTGCILRLFKNDLLHLKFDLSKDSYWIHRDQSQYSDLKNQF